MTPKFKPSDFVRRKKGSIVYEVLKNIRYSGEVKLRNTRTNKIQNLDESYLVLHSSNKSDMKNPNTLYSFTDTSDMKNSNTLYSFTDTSGMVLYGQHIGTNSQGEYVIEVKGSGQIIAMSKDALTEVLPYTIEVRFQDSATCSCFVSEEGAFAEKDFVMDISPSGGPRIGVVTKVNTKERNAYEAFTGRKIVLA